MASKKTIAMSANVTPTSTAIATPTAEELTTTLSINAAEKVKNMFNSFSETLADELNSIRKIHVSEDGGFSADYTRADGKDKLIIAKSYETAIKMDRLLTFDKTSSASIFATCRTLSLYNQDELNSLGFENVAELASALIGLAPSTAKLYTKIGARFINDDFTIKESVRDFRTVSQLLELLPLSDDVLFPLIKDGTLSPNVTAKKLREEVKRHKPIDEKTGKVKGEHTAKKENKDKMNKVENVSDALSVMISLTDYMLVDRETKITKEYINALYNIMDALNTLYSSWSGNSFIDVYVPSDNADDID